MAIHSSAIVWIRGPFPFPASEADITISSEVVKLIRSMKTFGIRALCTFQQKHWVITQEELQMVDVLESQRQS
jgi:hypothetical protein